MKRYRPLVLAICLLGFTAPCRAQQTQPATSPAGAPDGATRKKIEDYLRHLYAWGPDVKLTVAPLKETQIPGILETSADLEIGNQKDTARLYVSRDGRFLFRGELSDMTLDPLVETRARIQLEGAPAKGNPNASITLVEFADFECPVCKQLHDVLRGLLPNYPQARLVFKDFPLSHIHPWARTASLAGRCAYQQDPKTFWTLYDRIYDDQQVISAENAWNKMLDYAEAAGLNTDTFKTCMASPEAARAVDASFENGRQLEVNSTPTIFVNGRRMIGADGAQLEQLIRYELENRKAGTSPKKP